MMDISHLHLHVRDRALSAAFHRRWFELATKRSDDEITFMTGDRDFLLALTEDPTRASMPPWFHFGFRLDSAGDVRGMPGAMQAAGVVIVKRLLHEAEIASLRCV